MHDTFISGELFKGLDMFQCASGKVGETGIVLAVTTCRPLECAITCEISGDCAEFSFETGTCTCRKLNGLSVIKDTLQQSDMFCQK